MKSGLRPLFQVVDSLDGFSQSEIKFIRMVITRQPSVLNVKLPPANLYLDDLEEILNILKPDGEDQPPNLMFTVDDMTCDSMDDLRKIGGRRSTFIMDVAWEGAHLSDELRIIPHLRTSLHVGGGSAQRRAWVMNQVSDLFRRRIDWRAKYRWLIISSTGLFWLLILIVGGHFIHKITGRQGALHWILVAILGGLLSYPVYLALDSGERSTVILKSFSEEQGSWFRRHHDQIMLAAVTSLISGTIGAAIAMLVQNVFHQH